MTLGTSTAVRPWVTRRHVIATAVTATPSAALAACSVGNQSDGGGAKPTLKSGITLLMIQYGTQPEGEAKLEVLKLFEQKYPGIKAELDNTPGGGAAVNQKVQTMTASGTPPDLFWFGPALFLQYARAGFFLDMASRMRRDRFDLSDFPDKAIEQYSLETRRLAMPKDFPTRGMYFNASHFDEVGVPHPPGNYTDQSWTWDRFLQAAQKLTRDKGGVGHFGFNGGTGMRQYMPWVHGNGGELVNKDCTQCVLNEPAAIEALEFLQDLRVKHRVWVAAPDVQQGATFPLGRVGMQEGAPPDVGTFRRQISGFTWDATHVPRGKNGKYAASGGGTGQGISAGTKHPEEAWELMKHVLTPEALYIEIVKDQLNMPGRKSQSNSKEYLGTGQPPKSLKVFVDGLPNLRPDPQTTNWVDVEAALTKEMAPLWSGEKSAREVANAVKRAIDPLLQQADAKRRL